MIACTHLPAPATADTRAARGAADWGTASYLHRTHSCFRKYYTSIPLNDKCLKVDEEETCGISVAFFVCSIQTWSCFSQEPVMSWGLISASFIEHTFFTSDSTYSPLEFLCFDISKKGILSSLFLRRKKKSKSRKSHNWTGDVLSRRRAYIIITGVVE